jgi:hypothetical protein
MGEVPYRIAGGEPTRKWKYANGSGALSVLLGGPALGKIVDYYLGRIDPLMPSDVRTVTASFLAGLLTLGTMAIVGYWTRPARKDTPEIDPTAVPKPVAE